jgi:hypothetical protein
MKIVCGTKNAKLKRSLLKEMSCEDCYFKALHEIVINIANGKLKLGITEKKKLRKKIKYLERILSKPKSRTRRALAVKQSGGFLNVVIPAVITGLSEILRHAIN